jgi:hypothetical protein
MIQVLPQYFDLFQYNLEVEHYGLGLNFVVDNNTTIDRINFQQFLLEINTHASPFIVRNVRHIYNSTYLENGKNKELRSWESTLDEYITKYTNDIDLFGCNYFATSPLTGRKLVIRNKELMYFTKYFENWVITPVHSATNRNHIKEYNLFREAFIKKLGFVPNFGQMIATTLIATIFIDYNQDQLSSEFNKLKNDYAASGLLLEFISLRLFINNWIFFCNKIYYIHYSKPLDVIDKSIMLEQILEFSKNYQPYQFFHDCYNTIETQKQLLDSLPFVTNNRSLLDFN